jgi:hypothetical protein
VSLPMTTTAGDKPVMIAVDPLKASWTAAAVDAALQPLATVLAQSAVTATGRCAVSRAGGPMPSGRSKGQPGLGRR